MALSQTKEQRKPLPAELIGDNTDTVSGNDRMNNPSNADPSYATGLRLFMIMITINLSTMIASLDLVSPSSPPLSASSLLAFF
jgi:hypothetical protein